MGLFGRSASKPTRAERKAGRAEAKTAQQAAAAEEKAARSEARAAAKTAKAEAAATAEAEKAQRKVDARAEKAEAKAVKAEVVKAEPPAEKGSREPMTAKRAKRLIGVGQVVIPVLAPYALAVAGTVRGAWDARKAARLGVPADQLASFSGPGGALHARLSHVADALAKLDTKGNGAKSNGAKNNGRAFVTTTQARVTELALAVRAAEQMPAGRRRAAYKAIANELDSIESALLGQLGVTTS